MKKKFKRRGKGTIEKFLKLGHEHRGKKDPERKGSPSPFSFTWSFSSVVMRVKLRVYLGQRRGE